MDLPLRQTSVFFKIDLTFINQIDIKYCSQKVTDILSYLNLTTIRYL